MKNIFSILMICCATFAFANEKPRFEETDENDFTNYHVTPFSLKPPCCDDECDGEEEICDGSVRYFDCDEDNKCESSARYFGCDEEECNDPSRLFDCEEDECNGTLSYCGWEKYKASFGLESVYSRFPQNPTITQTSTVLNAYAYDHMVLYSFTGYFPPVGNINPNLWFNEILYNLSVYPFTILANSTFQDGNGNWVMDYAFIDNSQNLVTKCRAIATPFNGYTLQCVKPNGSKDSFDYFVDHFRIKCECSY